MGRIDAIGNNFPAKLLQVMRATEAQWLPLTLARSRPCRNLIQLMAMKEARPRVGALIRSLLLRLLALLLAISLATATA
jgi:hypothetical protein